MLERNPGCKLDLRWLNSVNINLTAMKDEMEDIFTSSILTKEQVTAFLLKAVTCIDLTTLGGDDTPSNVSRLCHKACRPIAVDVLEALGFQYSSDNQIHTAAVCVYPSKVEHAVSCLRNMGIIDKISIASVATGFPSGQMPLRTRLEEIRCSVENGATEIDIVINRSLVLTGKWEILYDEIKQMKDTCGANVHMKCILAAGELGNLGNVYKASMIAMMAGSDFIKTSTGKEAINAIIPFGIVMCRAIRDYYNKYGYKVGLKPAGGIRTSKDALNWLILVKELLGDDWLCPALFRLGASALLTDIEQNLFRSVYGYHAPAYAFLMG